MPSTNLALKSGRREDREDVHHRTDAKTADGRSVPVLIVNLSPNGLMARCDIALEPGTKLTFRLPDLDPITTEVRWWLGGRMGCEFAVTLPVNSYFAVLPRLRG